MYREFQVVIDGELLVLHCDRCGREVCAPEPEKIVEMDRNSDGLPMTLLCTPCYHDQYHA